MTKQEGSDQPRQRIGFYEFSHSADSLHDSEAQWRAFLAPLVDIKRVHLAGDHAFSAQAKLYNLGWALLLQTRSDGARYARSIGKVRRDDLDHFIFHIPLAGRSTFVIGDSIRHLRRLDLAAADLTAPNDFIAAPGPAISLILPRARLASLIERPDRLHGRILAATSPPGALLGRHLLTLSRCIASLDLHRAWALGEATTQLAASCLAAPAQRSETGPATSARPGLELEIRSYVEAHLHDLGLGPQMLADRFHLSRSQLYRLFDRPGGVCHYIRARRLRRAFELISRSERAPRRIGDIAYSLGFADDAHFSRVFRDRFGLSPRSARAAARRGDAGALTASAPIEGASPLGSWLRALASF